MIRTDCFFLLGINICAFRKFPDKLLIIFSFLLSTCNGNPYFRRKNVRFAYPKPVIVLFLNERNKLYSN